MAAPSYTASGRRSRREADTRRYTGGMGALIVPSWFVAEWAWEDELKYLGAILAALLVLMVRALRRERQM